MPRRIAVLTAATLGASFAAGPPAAAAPEAGGATAAPASGGVAAGYGSALGAYLAGRSARAMHDTEAAADFFSAALSSDPDSLILLPHAFRLMIEAGRIEEAHAIAQRVADAGLSPRGIAELVLATCAVKRGDYEEAERITANVPPRGLGALISELSYAWALHGAGRTDEAVALLNELDSRTLTAAFQHLHVGLILDSAGRTGEAGAALERALGVAGGGSVRIIEAYGRFLEREGQAEKARSLYDEVLAFSPDQPAIEEGRARIAAGRRPGKLVSSPVEGFAEVFYDAASALAQENARDAAMIYLRLALYLRPDLPIGLALLGDLLEADGRWAEALALYRQIDPDTSLGWKARLQIARGLNRLGRWEEAREILERMVEERATDTNTMGVLGDLLRERQQYTAAVEIYDRAIGLIDDPAEEDWGMFYARGMALERSRRWSEAEDSFLRALSLKPEQPLVLNYLGYSWIERGDNLARARGMIERAVELRPNDGYILDSLGWAQFHAAEFADAVRTLERAIEFTPEDFTINEHLGDAYWMVGRRLEARFQWRHALSLEPDPERIPIIERKLAHGYEGGPVHASAQGAEPGDLHRD